MKKIAVFLLMNCFYMPYAQTLTKKDVKFMNEASEGGMLEVRLGELSQMNAATPEVKSAGRTMVTDHSKANEELRSLASGKNVLLQENLTPKKQKKYDELAKLTGKNFDKAYAKYMVKDHKKDIAEFKKEAKSADDPAVKSWAQGKVATLEAHLQLWKDACKAAKK